jgi:hypothetical protein
MLFPQLGKVELDGVGVYLYGYYGVDHGVGHLISMTTEKTHDAIQRGLQPGSSLAILSPPLRTWSGLRSGGSSGNDNPRHAPWQSGSQPTLDSPRTRAPLCTVWRAA